MTEAAFQLSGIVQIFPGVRALDGADLTVLPGEVHGLVGENGAGKSTIIKVLAGVYQPDEGQIAVGGATVFPVTPDKIRAAGIRFIHQELHLVPHFTVAESVFMGQEISGPFGLSKRKMRSRAEAFLREELGSELPGNRLIRDLGPAERKLVQVARALVDGAAKVVVFDEPTAPLASEDVRTIMKAVAQLKSRGIAILYVSHYLNEIIDICDRVTVFRQGRNVAVFDTVSKETGPELVSAMIGRALDNFFPTTDREPGDVSLQLVGYDDGKAFSDVTLDIRRGEIFGIAGLIGSGREELIDALYGLRKSRGTLTLDGAPLDTRTAAKAVANGMVLVPRDRRHDGLVLPMTVTENATLATLDENASFGMIDRRKTRAVTERLINDLDIRPNNPLAVTRFLSGGNQQKVVLARWLAKSARIFIFDAPTVGVDVGAKTEIYQLIENLAAEGAIIVMSSSDPVELVGTCDRVAVMMRGKVRTIIDKPYLNVDHLVAVTTGATTVLEPADAS
ncbi:sugar ABC transporter ATP-binding protein [Roseicitreum antarcticum]|uniref:Monosaccharide ABC transporter ATP-binding protein, CUT2 family n=1 Tax=Roseicitreum antarcticum TaxID=564137 RepID=A0A1H2VBB9_9RHOB|nr:sugar ABC transporter ATP-binding protein [Roseicitreum antarcticum]SDW65615.1 monosaccharide ABC transporter ATP-binding protein, CUT2 family [Roseicitreum antarcticum]